MTNRIKKILPHIILLSPVLILAAYLRFFKLSQSDFISGDEYIYYTGSAIGLALKKLLENFIYILQHHKELNLYISILLKELPAFAKPGYNFIAAIATLILGESKTTAFYISAFFGVMTVAVVYMFVLALFNSNRIASIASLLLAVNSGHVLYTRMAHQVSGAIFFLVIAFLFYVKCRNDAKRAGLFRAFSAISYGIAFTIHPSVIYLIPVFFLLELKSVKNIFVFFGTFAISIIFWEIPRIIIHLLFILKGRISPFSNYLTALTPINNIGSYWNELMIMKRQHLISMNFGFSFFPSFLMDAQGLFYFGLLIIAMIYFLIISIRKITNYKYILLTLWVGAVYILYSLPLGARELRVYILTLPGLCVIEALFIDNLFSALKNRIFSKAISVSAICILLYIGVFSSQTIINSQLSYKGIADYIKANPSIDKVVMNVNTMQLGPTAMVCSWLDGFVVADYSFINWDGNIHVAKNHGRIAVFYRDKEESEKNPVILEGHPWGLWPEDIEKLYREGRARYLVTSVFDYQWFYGRSLKVEPIFYYNSPFVSKARCYEMGRTFSEHNTFHNDPYFRRIGLYDLKDIFRDKN